LIALAVTYVIKPENVDQAIEHFHALTSASRKEPGCLFYTVHRHDEEPRRFFIYEQYRDQAALAAHRAPPHFEQHGKNGVLKLHASRDAGLYTPLS